MLNFGFPIPELCIYIILKLKIQNYVNKFQYSRIVNLEIKLYICKKKKKTNKGEEDLEMGFGVLDLNQGEEE